MNSTDTEKRKMLDRAICFAVEKHSGGVRKGSGAPYILHPLEVMHLLSLMDGSIELLCAGVLHDTVEDTDTTAQELGEIFGGEVAALVAAHSEDKSKSWQERKEAAIAELDGASRDLRLLILADKLSNLRSMVRDHRRIGKELWSHFNAGKDRQAWFYSEMQDALEPLSDDEAAAPFYWELVMLYKELFITYLIDEENEVIYQIGVTGECWSISRTQPDWKQDRSPQSLPRVLPAESACAIVDRWVEEKVSRR